MTHAPRWLEPLLRQLEAEAPADTLLLAPDDHPLTETLRRRLPGTALTTAAPGDLPDRRFALAIVVETLESLPEADARVLLAGLRDLKARHVVLLADLARSPLTESALRALGFHLHARDGGQTLFGFELYGYKDRPEWLSPSHWAHPERWDKFRW